MNDIEMLRELYCYKKMYNHIFNVVTDVIERCRNEALRQELISAQQYTEGIYIGCTPREVPMTDDEKTIALLLSIFIKQERKRPEEEQDISLIEECMDWIAELEHGYI